MSSDAPPQESPRTIQSGAPDLDSQTWECTDAGAPGSELLGTGERSRRRDPEPRPEDEPPTQGPNLFLVYGLLTLFFLLAAACAAAIVWPFYHRR